MQPVDVPLFKVFMPETVGEELTKTIHGGFIAEGKKVQEFGSKISGYIGNPRVVLTNSCTMALTIAYRLSGVVPGTEVISTPLTCIASNIPILQLGATPVWADVDPETGMIDPEEVETLINEKTRAILVLHKEGDPARMAELIDIGRRHSVKIIEDAAHSFGSKYKGTKIGSHGDFVAFSFQAIKHITTGDGGALLCKDEEHYLSARKMKWFGVDRESRKSSHVWEQDIPDWGYKGNMNDIAATIGIEQMKHLDVIVDKFNSNGLRYSEFLKNVPGIKLIKRDPEDYSTFWAYCLLAENKNNLQEKLLSEGIDNRQIHYRNDEYSIFASSKRDLPNVDSFSQKELCIPCGWWVDEEIQNRICSIIKSGW